MRLHGLQYPDLNQIETELDNTSISWNIKQQETLLIFTCCQMFYVSWENWCFPLSVFLSMLPQPFVHKMHTPVVPYYLARYCLKCNTKLHHTISHLIIFYLWVMSLGCYSFQHVSPSVYLCAAWIDHLCFS